MSAPQSVLDALADAETLRWAVFYGGYDGSGITVATLEAARELTAANAHALAAEAEAGGYDFARPGLAALFSCWAARAAFRAVPALREDDEDEPVESEGAEEYPDDREMCRCPERPFPHLHD
jgi:hypothetical protein